MDFDRMVERYIQRKAEEYQQLKELIANFSVAKLILRKDSWAVVMRAKGRLSGGAESFIASKSLFLSGTFPLWLVTPQG